MRRSRLLKFMGLIAILAVILACSRPMSAGGTVRVARVPLQETYPGFDIERYEAFPEQQRCIHEGTEYVSWLVDFRKKGGPDGILVAIDYPEQRFPGPDVGWIDDISRDSRSFVPAPNDPGPMKWITSRGRR